MHKEKNIIDADFIFKQRLVSDDRCPKCNKGSMFRVSIHSEWDLEYRKEGKAIYLYADPIEYGICLVSCGQCGENITEERIHYKILRDIELTEHRKEVRLISE